MYINRFYSFFILYFIFCFTKSQHIKDSLSYRNIDDVIITGQYSPQSLAKSIYQVEIISEQDIKNRAASTLADVLNYNLNFLVVPKQDTGDSQVSLFGLNGQYFKVMIDNIPLVSDNGMGNTIDLTKINLDNVEQIEIVRGSMGVDYGSNSLTGIINIITKKKIPEKWKISGYAQEESVGNEYDWKEKGRHIQSLEVSHNLSNKWFISAGINSNNFQGFFDNKEGKRYYENDGKRGYEWLPKQQWNANALISFKSKNFSAFYKVQFLDEIIKYYNPIVKYAPLYLGGLYTYSSTDRDYNTQRWLHHVFLKTRFFNQIDYNGDFSYQEQNRKYRDYIYDIGKREVFNFKNPYKSYAKTEAWYNRGTFSNFIKSKILDFQLGYEINLIEGFRAANSASIAGLNVSGFQEDVRKHLDNYDIFISSEIRTNVGLSLRPGFRSSFNSKFENQYSYSFAMKYELSKLSDIRAEFSSSNRTPNFDELYTYFVDSNHDIQGNSDLNPEKGYSTAIHWNQKIISNNDLKTSFNLSTLYIELKDKIELSTVSIVPLHYKYINIDKYSSWGIQGGNSFQYKNIDFSLGASVFGISRKLNDNINGIHVTVPNDKYLYNFQLNSNVNYTIQKWETTISIYYKYTGKESGYIYDSNSDSFYLGKQEDFNQLDASIRKYLFKNKIEITAGVRNIFDIKNVNTTAAQSGAHQGPISSINLFYGRSYFLKLGFNLDF